MKTFCKFLFVGLLASCTSTKQVEVTLLHDAVNRSEVHQAEQLILAGADVNRRVEGKEAWTSLAYPEHWTEGFTPLHIAASKGDVEMIRLLLDHGADAQLQTQEGMLPLDLAIYYSNIDPVEKYEARWDELVPGYNPAHAEAAQCLGLVTQTEEEWVTDLQYAEEAGYALARDMLEMYSPLEALEKHGATLRAQALRGEPYLESGTAYRALLCLSDVYSEEFPKPPEQDATDPLAPFKTRGSLLLGTLPAGQAIDLLSFETLCLQPWSMLSFNLIYFHGLDTGTPETSIPQHDPRVRDVWIKLSEERVPRALLAVGKMHLYGAGIPQDIENGQNMLRETRLGDAVMALAMFAYQKGNMEEAAREWIRAGQDFDDPEGWYNAAVLAYDQNEMGVSVYRLHRALEVSSEYAPAQQRLGWHLLTGTGTEKNVEKAAALFKEVLEKEDVDPDVREAALQNLAYLLRQMNDASPQGNGVGRETNESPLRN